MITAIRTLPILSHPALVALATASILCAESTRPGEVILKPPMHGLEEVGYQNVKLRGGFWGPRLETHHHTTIPYVLDKLEERDHITNFDKAAKAVKSGTVKTGAAGSSTNAAEEALQGDAAKKSNAGPGSVETGKADPDAIVGHSAYDSDVHKAMEGACYSLRHHEDAALRQRVDSILERILASQQDDGYLVSYFIAKEPEGKWANLRLNHEMYNAGHLFEFAVAHHQLTRETKALDAAKRFADHIDKTFGPDKRYDVDGHQEVELALVKLYRATGEKRYLDLCRFFLEERGHLHGAERKPFTEIIPCGDPPRLPDETMQEWRRKKWSMRNGRMQDHKPVLEQTEAVGHAVRAGYMYAAMADLARFSDAPEYAKAVRTLWEDVVFRKMYLTGGIGTAQYGDEGFGDPYLLPNKTYCESCACIANVLWQHRMCLMDADAKYADVMELALYNSAIAGMSLSGNSFFYQNPLESLNGAERSPWIGLACCPTNHSRFTPQVGGFVYASGAGKLDVNLYAAGEASIDMDGRNVTLRQETDFPWDGKIKLTVGSESPAAFDFRLRIPSWARGNSVPGDLYQYATPDSSSVTLAVNGEAVDAAPGKDGYVSLNRTWKKGDTVELDLPMPVRRVHSHEKLLENRGRVALMRGPVVYCFEGIDNPGVDPFKMTLPPEAGLTATHRADLLNGVTVVNATGLDEQGKPVKLTAIPYFAWANRGKCPMNLWVHEQK